jgi:hypothetical protein
LIEVSTMIRFGFNIRTKLASATTSRSWPRPGDAERRLRQMASTAKSSSAANNRSPAQRYADVEH